MMTPLPGCESSASSAGLLLRLVGLGGGTGGCLAWGGTGGGASESAEEGAAGEGRGGSSTISETVLGGLATGKAAEEEEEEEDDEEEDGVELLVESVEGAVRDVGGSRACLGGGGSCWKSFAGRGSGAKRTPADSERSLNSAAGMYLGRVLLLSASEAGRAFLLSSEELFCREGRKSISETGLTIGRESSPER